MSAPSLASTTDVTANNAQVFVKYHERLSNTEHYPDFANRLARWLSDSRAYYDAARPEIVKLLQHAQTTLKTALGVHAAAPFNVYNHPTNHPMIQSYISLVRTVYRFIRKFNHEDQLRRQIEVLHRSTVNPAEIIDVDDSPPPSATSQSSSGFPTNTPQSSQPPPPSVPAPQPSASDVPKVPVIAENLTQVENAQATSSASPAPSAPLKPNKRKAAKTGSSTKPRKRPKKIELNWDEIRKIDESHHLGRQSQEAEATSTPERTIDVSLSHSIPLPSATISTGPITAISASTHQPPAQSSESADVARPTESGMQRFSGAHDTSSAVKSMEAVSKPCTPTTTNLVLPSDSISTRNTPVPAIGPAVESLMSQSKSTSPALRSDAGTPNFLDQAFKDGSPAMQSPAPGTVLPVHSGHDGQTPEITSTKTVNIKVKTEDQEDELDEAGVVEELIEPGSGINDSLIERSVAQEITQTSTAESVLPSREPQTTAALPQSMSSAGFEPSENISPTAPLESAQPLKNMVEEESTKEVSPRPPEASTSIGYTDVPMADIQTGVEEQWFSVSVIEDTELSRAVAELSVNNSSEDVYDETKAAEGGLHKTALHRTQVTSNGGSSSADDVGRHDGDFVDAMHIDAPAPESGSIALVDNSPGGANASHVVLQGATVQNATASSRSHSPMPTTPVAVPILAPFALSELPLATVVQNATNAISEQQVNMFKAMITNRSMDAADIRIPSFHGFDDRAKMLQKAEGRQTGATITLIIHVSPAQFESITLWKNRFHEFTNSAMTKGLCISLACYRREDIERELKVSVHQTFPHLLYNSLKCVWPRGSKKLVMKVVSNEQARTFSLSPPMVTTADNFVDLGPFIVEGKNIIQIDQSDDMSRYTFCLHAHYPTKRQLEEVQSSMKRNEEWQQWLQHVVRPLELPPSPFAQVSA